MSLPVQHRNRAPVDLHELYERFADGTGAEPGAPQRHPIRAAPASPPLAANPERAGAGIPRGAVGVPVDTRPPVWPLASTPSSRGLSPSGWDNSPAQDAR